MPSYAGGCHCGQVRLRIDLPRPIDRVIDCNCSICTKKGILHVAVEMDELAVLQGRDSIETYRFNTRIAEHNFCRRCGIHVYTRPRNHPDRLSVNARCLDDFHQIRSSVEIVPLDGQNHPKDQASSPD